MQLRPSTSSDRPAIRAVHLDAFGPDEGPVIVELVDAMFDDPTAQPMLSLVAEEDSRIVGHVFFSAARLESDDRAISVRILAPLAVSRDLQNRGIGGALIRDGFERLTADGVGLVFVLGYPDYYAKFGFQPAGAHGLDAPHPLEPHQADAWMVHELKPGAIGSVRGVVHCSDVLEQPQYWRE